MEYLFSCTVQEVDEERTFEVYVNAEDGEEAQELVYTTFAAPHFDVSEGERLIIQ